MRLAYLGTPEIAVQPLRGLHDAGHSIDLVVTGPDARRGRGSALSPCPVKAVAEELGLRVTHDLADLDALDVDLGVVVAFGRILPAELVHRIPMVNLHFSLLPAWRGAAPVERAILAGDAEIGVCVMAVEEGLDTGGVYAQRATDIGVKTLAELWAELSTTGTELLVELLAGWTPESGIGEPRAQVGEPTYAHKLTVEDRRLTDGLGPVERLARVRLGNAWMMVGDKRVRVLSAEVTGSGEFRMIEVQPEGKRPMSFEAWSNGLTPQQRAELA